MATTASKQKAQLKYRESGRKSEVEKKRYIKNKEEHYARCRKNAIRKQYNMSVDEYNLIMQNPCSICGEESKHLDHDHETGLVRGPLCRHCNLGLGHFKDNPELLKIAIEHLKGVN